MLKSANKNEDLEGAKRISSRTTCQTESRASNGARVGKALGWHEEHEGEHTKVYQPEAVIGDDREDSRLGLSQKGRSWVRPWVIWTVRGHHGLNFEYRNGGSR